MHLIFYLKILILYLNDSPKWSLTMPIVFKNLSVLSFVLAIIFFLQNGGIYSPPQVLSWALSDNNCYWIKVGEGIYFKLFQENSFGQSNQLLIQKQIHWQESWIPLVKPWTLWMINLIYIAINSGHRVPQTNQKNSGKGVRILGCPNSTQIILPQEVT